MKISVLALAAFVVAAPAGAQVTGAVGGNGAAIETGQGNAPEGLSQGGTNENGERLICRRVEAGSASRMATRRVCLTAREWRERQ